MKTAQKVVRPLRPFLDGKAVLEVACGDSSFSAAAAKYAANVLASDISLERAQRIGLEKFPKNVRFRQADAAALNFPTGTFDTVVCYNALGHLQTVLPAVLAEMTRTAAPGGYLIFAATWEMDFSLLNEVQALAEEIPRLSAVSAPQISGCQLLILEKHL